MRKKIVFMIINMNVGGTEKALLNMMLEMPRDTYEITVLMLEEYGGFLEHIPGDINIEYFKNYRGIKDVLNKPPKVTTLQLFKNGQIIKAFSLLMMYLISKIVKDKSIFFKYILSTCPEMESEYDIAVAYAGPMDFISYFVVNKIKAKKKIQWVHFDITKIGFDQNFVSKIYKKFDKIFVVSNEGKTKLINLLPNIKEKVDNFTNIISKDFVVKMADKGKGFDDDFCGVRILTVGRLSREKGQDLTIPILSKLKKAGYNVRWYCIGDGSERLEYEQLIREHNVEKDYILLGSISNPYPYMKQCDIYVQSSRHEGYCITLSEARCFNNPIVTTNFTGANEQISNEETGLIVDFDERKMYTALQRLLNDERIRNKFKYNLHQESVDTTKEIEKLYKIADNF
ncbi:glycosyltransferase [Priestia aryabhattai]|uniref:glycosyltransferase n=1 Tax=Priestia aryabhattai TaxID=412384 RepID=UPI000BF2F380|nr:glycosyltransferase [Priestia aryabhattai]PGA19853.1 glycosyl transferase [Priestia aryabhattai]